VIVRRPWRAIRRMAPPDDSVASVLAWSRLVTAVALGGLLLVIVLVVGLVSVITSL
jgi:hypothetical protein